MINSQEENATFYYIFKLPNFSKNNARFALGGYKYTAIQNSGANKI